MLEIESKAKVKDFREIEKKLKKFAKFVKSENKVDYYFKRRSEKGIPKNRIRLRSINNKIFTVNHKRKYSIHKRFEQNHEFEFRIDNPKAFFELMKDYGFVHFITKIKKNRTYGYRNANIELNNVRHLGNFVEIEVLCRNKSQIKKAKSLINLVYKKLSIPESAIFTKGYTTSLYKLGKAIRK